RREDVLRVLSNRRPGIELEQPVARNEMREALRLERLQPGVRLRLAAAGSRQHERDDDRGPGEVRYGATNPMRSYISCSVGADVSRALSAPMRRSRRSSASSARSSVYRSRIGVNSSTTASPTSSLSVPYPWPSYEVSTSGI